MARLSDAIEEFIKKMLETSTKHEIQIQRNELASIFNCAPSQINYVLTTRFSVNKGYYIESKRGGGGCIKITRANLVKHHHVKDVILSSIKDSLTQGEAFQYIDLFIERGLITQREETIMKYAVSDNTLSITSTLRDLVRAKILKSMLISVLD